MWRPCSSRDIQRVFALVTAGHQRAVTIWNIFNFIYLSINWIQAVTIWLVENSNVHIFSNELSWSFKVIRTGGEVGSLSTQGNYLAKLYPIVKLRISLGGLSKVLSWEIDYEDRNSNLVFTLSYFPFKLLSSCRVQVIHHLPLFSRILIGTEFNQGNGIVNTHIPLTYREWKWQINIKIFHRIIDEGKPSLLWLSLPKAIRAFINIQTKVSFL